MLLLLSKEQCGKLTHYTDVTLRSIPQWNRTIAYGFGDRRSTIELGAFTKNSRYKPSSSLCATGRIQTYVVLMTANLQSAPFGRSGTVAYTCTLCVCHTSIVSEMVSDSSSEQDKNIISHFEVLMQILFVPLTGFEPATPRFGIWCSIR